MDKLVGLAGPLGRAGLAWALLMSAAVLLLVLFFIVVALVYLGNGDPAVTARAYDVMGQIVRLVGAIRGRQALLAAPPPSSMPQVPSGGGERVPDDLPEGPPDEVPPAADPRVAALG